MTAEKWNAQNIAPKPNSHNFFAVTDPRNYRGIRVTIKHFLASDKMQSFRDISYF